MRIEAVFLDRDGVINRERSDYVKSEQEFELLPGALGALARLALLRCPILVISNQSAIGRGLLSSETLDSIHAELRLAVEAQGGRIDSFYICPHHPDERCICRKPQPGLLLQAAQEYDLKLGNCVFVGDAVTDFEAAAAAGCKVILVRSGKQGPLLDGLIGDDSEVPIVQDLAEAVALILGEEGVIEGKSGQ